MTSLIYNKSDVIFYFFSKSNKQRNEIFGPISKKEIKIVRKINEGIFNIKSKKLNPKI